MVHLHNDPNFDRGMVSKFNSKMIHECSYVVLVFPESPFDFGSITNDNSIYQFGIPNTCYKPHVNLEFLV